MDTSLSFAEQLQFHFLLTPTLLLLALTLSSVFAIIYYTKFRVAKENLRLTLQATSDIVFLIDKNFCYLEVYAGNDNILAQSREKLIGRPITQVLDPETGAKVLTSLQNTFSTGKRQIVNYELTLNNELCYFEASLEPRDSNVVVAVIRNITQTTNLQKQIELERAKQIESARLAGLGQLAGGIAHEVNTPLAVILANAQGLEREIDCQPFDTNKIKTKIQRILETTNHISAIIKGLRALSRDGSKDAFEIVSVETIIHHALSYCSDQFFSMGVEIQTEIPKNLKINCRSVQISQVLLNLLNNASYATLNQTEERPLIIVTARSVNNHNIEIAVANTGPLIPKTTQMKLFEPFFTTKKFGEGTGLGLSISKRIVHVNNGELTFDSTSDRTRFCLTFPAI